MTSLHSIFSRSAGLAIAAVLLAAIPARAGNTPEQELSTGVTFSLPLIMGFLEYGIGPVALGGGGGYCYDAVEGQSFGYHVSAKAYLVPGYLYVKAGYGIAGLETGGRFGALNRPLYGAEVLCGGRLLVGEESPYFFLALEAGAAVRTENVVQEEILSKPGRVFPKISLSAGMSFLRDYY